MIGSVYASLYASRLTEALPRALPAQFSGQAHDSVGAALEIADRTSAAGRPGLGAHVHAAASDAFFQGFSAGCLVAAGVSAAGVIMAAVLLPSQPSSQEELAAAVSAVNA